MCGLGRCLQPQEGVWKPGYKFILYVTLYLFDGGNPGAGGGLFGFGAAI